MAKKPASAKQVILSGRVFDEVIMTLEECKVYADKWKDRLGLRDWVVVLGICRMRDMGLQGKQGTVQGSEEKRFMYMNLLHPDDYEAVVPQNMKRTILHELAHVVLYPLNIKRKLHTEEEQIVEALAAAIYNLEAGNQ